MLEKKYIKQVNSNLLMDKDEKHAHNLQKNFTQIHNKLYL